MVVDASDDPPSRPVRTVAPRPNRRPEPTQGIDPIRTTTAKDWSVPADNSDVIQIPADFSIRWECAGARSKAGEPIGLIGKDRFRRLVNSSGGVDDADAR